MAPLKKIGFSDQEVSLAAIVWQDEVCRMTWGRPLRPLRRSLEAVGLQETPVLQPLPAGRFRIVAGRRRLLVLRDLALESCPARLIPADQPARDLVLFNLYHNLGSHDFNVVERALIVSRLARYFPEETLVRDFLPLIGLAPHQAVGRRFLLLAELSPHFWPAFIQGRLFPETLDLISPNMRPWIEPLLTLCLNLHFGFQKQKEMLEGLQELMLRREGGIEAVLRSTGLSALLCRESLPQTQKGEAWRRSLRSALYPSLTETERSFAEQVRDMALDERTRIKPPPFFEGGRYELTMPFASPGDLETSLERVRLALKAGKLDHLP